MTKKIFTGMIVVAVVMLLICTGLVMGVMYDYMGSQIDKELRNEAEMVAIGLGKDSQSYLSMLKTTGGLKSRITLIAPDGHVRFDSMNDETTMENHLKREEIQEALRDGEGYAVRKSATMAKQTRYYALRLTDGSLLRLSTDHYSQLGLLLDTAGILVIIVAVLVVLAALIAHVVTKKIVKPINAIDLQDPDIDEHYDELVPFLRRIREQNSRIDQQIETLSRQQTEFRLITEQMKEGLVIIDATYHVLTCNRSALQILGEKKEELAQKSATCPDPEGIHVFALNRSEPFRRAVEDTLEGKQSRRAMTIRNRTYEILAGPVVRTGETMAYSGEKKTVQTEKTGVGAQIDGAILIIVDVTEREIGEQMRREFTSNVSHELKTPLTSIYGVADMLAGGLVKPEDVGQFAETIREESARMIALIDDIMQLSRLDENQIEQKKEAVDLYQIAVDVVARLMPKAREKGVTLTLQGEKTILRGVDYVLDEILYNLCENAIKYNRAGGQATVTVNMMPDGATIQVADTGVGIPEEDIPRVVERFYRVDKSHSSAIPGTGLGLSIVKHGAAYHGGTVSIASESGKGTTVTVKLPA